MSTEFLPSIETAKANCEEHQTLQAQLPLLRETLGKEVYRAEAIESCLDEIQQNLDALQGLTPISLIKSLVGSKQRSINNAQKEQG